MSNNTRIRRTLGTLLLVDDSSTARHQLRQAFELAGFDVTEAAEGVEAMWRARKQRYDVVITDVHMPTMDGLEFLGELRKLPGYAAIPVYVLTSDCSRERMESGRRLGATAWIVKPPQLEPLIHAVRKALGHSRADRESASDPPAARFGR